MHCGGVDGEGTDAQWERNARHLDGNFKVDDATASEGCPDRVGAETGAGSRIDTLVPDDGGQRPGCLQRLERRVEDNGGEVNEDWFEDCGEGIDRDSARADREPQRVHAILDVGDDVLGGALGIGIGEPRPDVPAFELTRRGCATRERRLAR